jgi:hypothetical protein
MPDLTILSWVDDLAGEHVFYTLGDVLVLGDRVEQGKALGVDFGMRVVEPNFVENLKSECLISTLIL